MAARRFLTAEQGVEQLLKATPPLHFKGTTKTEWQEWRRKFRRNLVKDLGPSPEALPLEVEILEEIKLDGYTRKKIIFNPDPFSSIPAYVFNPGKCKREESSTCSIMCTRTRSRQRWGSRDCGGISETVRRGTGEAWFCYISTRLAVLR